MNKAGVPYGGIAADRARHAARRRSERSGARRGLRDRPERAPAFGILVSWAMIVLCQLKLVAVVQAGHAAAARAFRMLGQSLHRLSGPGFPRRRAGPDRLRLPGRNVDRRLPSSDHPAAVAGWFACRNRILAIAEERLGFTGELPVLAKRPLAASKESGPTEKKTDPESTD